MNANVKTMVDAVAAPIGVTSAIVIKFTDFVNLFADIAGLTLTLLGIAWYIVRFKEYSRKGGKPNDES